MIRHAFANRRQIIHALTSGHDRVSVADAAKALGFAQHRSLNTRMRSLGIRRIRRPEFLIIAVTP